MVFPTGRFIVDPPLFGALGADFPPATHGTPFVAAPLTETTIGAGVFFSFVHDTAADLSNNRLLG
jgi:hypothetical protein